MKNNIYNELFQDLNQPMFQGKSFFSKGGLRVIIINEDMSANEYFLKLPKSYVIQLKDKSYFLVPKCVLRMKFPTIIYYYNNPFPIGFKYEKSNVKATDLYNDESLELLNNEIKVHLSNTIIDAEMVKLGFDNRFMKGIYAQGGMTVKNYLLIMGAVLIVILVLLQVSGKVDVMGNLYSFMGTGVGN